MALPFATRAWRALSLLSLVGCHMVGYGSEPLTTDAGEPVTAADDADVARSDAETLPDTTSASDASDVSDAGDAPLDDVASARDGAAELPGTSAAEPSMRDPDARPRPRPESDRQRGDACRGPEACDLTCARAADDAVCTARCVDTPLCALRCEGPSAGRGPGALACQLGCDGVTTCIPACAPGSRCAVRCRDTQECFVGCEGGSACEVACESSTCAVNCAPGAACLIRCAPGTACGFWGCRTGERVCENGVRACGTRCPEDR